MDHWFSCNFFGSAGIQTQKCGFYPKMTIKFHNSGTKHRVKMASTIFWGSFEPENRWKKIWNFAIFRPLFGPFLAHFLSHFLAHFWPKFLKHRVKTTSTIMLCSFEPEKWWNLFYWNLAIFWPFLDHFWHFFTCLSFFHNI